MKSGKDSLTVKPKPNWLKVSVGSGLSSPLSPLTVVRLTCTAFAEPSGIML